MRRFIVSHHFNASLNTIRIMALYHRAILLRRCEYRPGGKIKGALKKVMIVIDVAVCCLNKRSRRERSQVVPHRRMQERAAPDW